jgi:hypothetical protein
MDSGEGGERVIHKIRNLGRRKGKVIVIPPEKPERIARGPETQG